VEDEDQEHAKMLFERAKEYSLKSLDIRGQRPAPETLEDFKEALKGLGKEDLPIFSGRLLLANWIRCNLDSMEPWPNSQGGMDDGKSLGGRRRILLRRPHLFMGYGLLPDPKWLG